ncbi:hypothetical protein [Erythrobacter sp. CCH5-A1]|uniref:hypothetical protein n=1 Tax=Erythrobacter sp. CCH5-A1 TaxID=1768792 RepID=UPI000AB8F563|nr:hypothetical protein [Erythrobacter sp. CCH5-A1]
MSEQFTARMNRFFGARRGGFSPVTQDEFSKSQITFVGPEQELAEEFFGDTLELRHGSIDAIKAKGVDPELPYRLYPSGRRIKLTTSYKTNKPRELRLYLRVDQFKPLPGWFWGVFERGNELWLCEMSPDMLEKINSGILDPEDRNENLESEVDNFQLDLNDPEAPEKKANVTYQYGRDRRVALDALNRAGFVCELFPDFPTFISRSSGLAFMEAHHLIPMKLQDNFSHSLDVVENICCFNPWSHRLVHSGKFDVFEEQLARIVRLRSDFIKSVGWIEDDVLALYAI